VKRILFLSILIVLSGCAAKSTVIVEKTQKQNAKTIVNNNRDWVGIGVVAGTLLAGYGIWEYYKWKQSSKSQDRMSEKSLPEARSTD
jgi:hypothetical protein